MAEGLIISSIIGLVVFFIIMSILFHFAKKAVKWALILFLIFTVLSTVFGINVLRDAYALKEKFPTSEKLFLLKDGQEIIAGFEGKLFDSDDVISYLDGQELQAHQDLYNERDFESLRGSHFKVFVIDLGAFTSLSKVTIGGASLDAGQFIQAFRTEDTNDIIVKQLLSAQSLPSTDDAVKAMRSSIQSQLGASSDAELKGAFFALMFSSASSENPLFIITEFKKYGLVIYPETIIFKVLRIVPSGLIDGVFDKLVVQKEA